jgi:hypothetical protein
MDKHTLYSNHNTGVHIFIRTTPNGKESVVSSEEMKTYKRGNHFDSVMDIHHALVRFTYEQVGGLDAGVHMETIDSILRIPFDKANEIIIEDN